MTSTQILERARETIVEDGQTAKNTDKDDKGRRCVAGHLLEAAGLDVEDDWGRLGVEGTAVNKAALRLTTGTGFAVRPVAFAAYNVCTLNNRDPGIDNIVATFDRALAVN